MLPEFHLLLDSFGPVCAIATLFNGFPRPWFVAGGWAIDLFLGIVTRPHKDVDLMILREDQGLLHAYLAGWELSKVENQHGMAEWTRWKEGEWLEQPSSLIRSHQVSGYPDMFEVYLLDTSSGLWRFHRDPAITRSLEEIGAYSTIEGIPFFAPEIMLLWKAKYHRPKDEHDFRVAIPRFNIAQRVWLRNALQLHCPTDPWLVELR